MKNVDRASTNMRFDSNIVCIRTISYVGISRLLPFNGSKALLLVQVYLCTSLFPSFYSVGYPVTFFFLVRTFLWSVVPPPLCFVVVVLQYVMNIVDLFFS